VSKVNLILKQYACFESKVQKEITTRCSQYCSSCSHICCTPEFCQETLESPFLSLVRKRFSPYARYMKNRGWWSENGCTLSFGRPPVCYEFMCNDIIDDQPTDSDLYTIKILSKLISHVGKNALGRLHIVEIMKERHLHNIQHTRFEKKLSEAKAAFIAVKLLYTHNCIDNNSLKTLSKILRPPWSLI